MIYNKDILKYTYIEMANYLPPVKVSELFNLDDYSFQDGYIMYKVSSYSSRGTMPE
jgi:hypothetical protein